MRCYITSYDVQKRCSILEQYNDSSYPDKQCFLLKEKASKSKNDIDIRNFFIECGKSNNNATYFYEDCIDMLQESESKELMQIFVNNILTKVDGLSVTDNIKDDHIKEAVINQQIKNKVCDRILENNSHICNRFNLSKYADQPSVTLENIIDKTCHTIGSFSMPIYAKFNTAIEECSYLLGIKAIDYKESYLINRIFENYCLMFPVTKKDIDLMQKSVKENYCLTEVYSDIANIYVPEVKSSKIDDVCRKFLLNSNQDIYSLNTIKAAVLKSGELELTKNISIFLQFLLDITVHSYSENLAKFIATEMLPVLYDDIYNMYESSTKIRDMFISIDLAAKTTIEKCDALVKSLNISNDRIFYFKNALEDFDAKVLSALEFIYPKYNIECMTITNTLSESNELVSLEEFKMLELENFKNDVSKVSKYIQESFDRLNLNVSRDTSVISENADIMDMVLEDGIVDCTVASYKYENCDIDKLHTICTNTILSINENLLAYNDNVICYYIMNSGNVEFNLRTKNPAISLNETENDLLINRISDRLSERMTNIIYNASLVNENFDLKKEAIQYFSDDSHSRDFKEFANLCSLAGVTKETIDSIYESALDNVEDRTAFVIDNAMIKENYTINLSESTDIAFESLAVIEDMLRPDLITEALADYWNDDEDDEDEDDDKEEDKKNDKKEDTKKDIKKDNNIKKPEVKKDNNQENIKKDDNKQQDIKKEENKQPEKKEMEKGIKGFKLNNLKLYIAGLRKKMKDLGSKAKTAIMNMDASAERFKTAIKKFFVSDRREAIIKGSIIPSFHKCIVMALAFAGGMIINPPLAIIGAFAGIAVSKNLTKKERALMYDDIMVELQIVEKEIQMADSKDQTNKLRELLRIKKELERTATRIKYNARIGKDIIPGGHYVNRDED